MERQFLTKKQFEKWNMSSVNLEKTLEYLKIQESLRSENLKGIKEYFYMFSSNLKDITEAQSKTNQTIS